MWGLLSKNVNCSAIPLSWNIFLSYKLRLSRDHTEKSSTILYIDDASAETILLLVDASNNGGGLLMDALGFGVLMCSWVSKNIVFANDLW